MAMEPIPIAWCMIVSVLGHMVRHLEVERIRMQQEYPASTGRFRPDGRGGTCAPVESLGTRTGVQETIRAGCVL